MNHDLTMEEVLQILKDLAGIFGPSIRLSSLIQAIERNRHQFDCVGCGLSLEALSPVALLDCPAPRAGSARSAAGINKKHSPCPRRQLMRPEIVCLCGSTRFKKEFEAATKDLTLRGKIVLSVGFFGHCEPEFPRPEVKQMLDALHLRKIDLSDWVLVINPGGYVGESTAREIRYARQMEKQVCFLEQEAEAA